jgi:hypothetical protein
MAAISSRFGAQDRAWFPTDLGDKFMGASIATPDELRSVGLTERDFAD